MKTNRGFQIIKKVFLFSLSILVLSSGKCNQKLPSDLVILASKKTVMGGVFGSGFSYNYTFIFNKLISDTLEIDSIFIKVDETICYKKLHQNEFIRVMKNEENLYQVEISFQGGDRMQGNGEIIRIEIPTYPIPDSLKNYSSLIYGKYKFKPFVYGIDKISKGEDIFAP